MEVSKPNVKPSSSKLFAVNSHNTPRDNKDKIVIDQNLNNNNDDDCDLFNFPPGYRFCPFDEELILYYLKKKVMNQKLPLNKIQEVNLYKYNPEELSGVYPTLGEKEWYFFTPRDRKYRNGNRPNRAAGSGYWKATGADKPIKHEDQGTVSTIGFRKALVFYEGRPPKGDKTNWIMHEYRVKEAPPPKTRGGVNDMRLDDWVLCRIYKKVDKSVKCARKNEDFESTQLSSHRQPTSPHNKDDDDHISATDLEKEESTMTSVYRQEVRFPFLPNEMPPFHPDIEFGNKFSSAIPNNVNQRFISCGPLAGKDAPAAYQDPHITPASLVIPKYVRPDDTFQENIYNQVDFANYMLPTDPILNIDDILSPSADIYPNIDDPMWTRD